MMKNTFALLVASVTTSLLAGCQLYFGGESSDDRWNYCGSDGYYECEGDDCAWRGPECPAGSGSGSGGTGGGFECNGDADCAAGCYCSDSGYCEEAGFCTQDSDCGPGYVCDEMRSSCEPGDTGCSADTDCAEGQYCNAGGQCVTATCGGEPTCNDVAPVCPPGQTPTMVDGCWTGACQVTAECTEAPSCSRINDETNCLSRTADCSPVYTGDNCSRPDGTACTPGDTNCTCQTFSFHSCRNKTASTRTITLDDGRQVDGAIWQLN